MYPADLRYTKDHEWIRVTGNEALVGITNYAQEQLGDVVFVQQPGIGRKVKRGEACAVVESVKAASDIPAPVGGEVVAVNPAATDAPEKLNQDPYGTWLFRIKPADAAELAQLLDAAAYSKAVAAG